MGQAHPQPRQRIAGGGHIDVKQLVRGLQRHVKILKGVALEFLSFLIGARDVFLLDGADFSIERTRRTAKKLSDYVVAFDCHNCHEYQYMAGDTTLYSLFYRGNIPHETLSKLSSDGKVVGRVLGYPCPGEVGSQYEYSISVKWEDEWIPVVTSLCANPTPQSNAIFGNTLTQFRRAFQAFGVDVKGKCTKLMSEETVGMHLIKAAGCADADSKDRNDAILELWKHRKDVLECLHSYGEYQRHADIIEACTDASQLGDAISAHRSAFLVIGALLFRNIFPTLSREQGEDASEHVKGLLDELEKL